MTYLGAIARAGKVVVELLDKIHQPRSESLRKAVVRFIRDNVINGGSQLMTDGFEAYEQLSADIPHHVVTDKREIVDDVQQIEGFWAGIKRVSTALTITIQGSTHRYISRKLCLSSTGGGLSGILRVKLVPPVVM